MSGAVSRPGVPIGWIVISQSAFLLAAAVVVGIGGGFGAVLFRKLIVLEHAFAFGLPGAWLRSRIGAIGLLVQLALGGAFAAWIASRFAPEAKGHGVPEVMEAVALRKGKMRPRVIAVKALASASTIGFGGSAGREGPIVQIGAAIGSVLGQLVQAPSTVVRTLVACGAAAGISATFNAPLGGVFFAAEVILGDFAPRSFAAIVVSSALAAVVGRTFLGNHPSFDASAFVLVSPIELAFYATLGVIAAIWATGFVRMLYAIEDSFDGLRWSPVLKGMLGFTAVGALGIWFPQILGVGYDRIQQVLYHHVDGTHAFVLAILKPLATSLTLGAGGSGGIFSPSLFTGAFLGDAFGHVVHTMLPAVTGPAAAYGLVGMAAVFAAAAEAPVTAITILFEMSNDYTIILPLMIAVVIATLLGRKLLGSTVYEMKLVRRGIDWQRVRRQQPMADAVVSSVMRRPSAVVAASETVASVAARREALAETVLPVCDGGAYVGVVTAADLATALAHGRGGERIAAIIRREVPTVAPSENIEIAASKMVDAEIPVLPVVSPADAKLLGVVSGRDVLRAYRVSADS